MTPYGISLLATMALGFLPWSYLFEGLGRIRSAARLPLIVSLIFVVLSSALYAQMLMRFGPDGRGWAMIIFLATTIQIGSIAVGGMFWSIVGQGAARRFLRTPLPLLLLTLVVALFTLYFSLTFTPAV